MAPKFIQQLPGANGWRSGGYEFVIDDSGTFSYGNQRDGFTQVGETLSNPSQQNNVFQFVQTTKPTERSAGVALVAGDRWYKTDDETEWFWNGAAFLSIAAYNSVSTRTFTVSSNPDFDFNPALNIDFTSNSFYVEKVQYRLYCATADASNNWVVTNRLNVMTASAISATANLSLFSITVDSAGTRQGELSVNTVYSSSNIPISIYAFATKTGSPANLLAVVNFVLRRVYA